MPFKGNNGPSILLEILTKEAVPPSVSGKAQKFPVPPTLDRVIAQAFRKSPGQRTASVGALASAVGRAYGLDGDHTSWDAVPQAELGAAIAAKMDQLMKTVGPTLGDASDAFFGEAGALESIDDPFAAGPAAPVQPEALMAPTPTLDDVPFTVPKSNGWILPVLVGAFALVVGVVVVLVVM